MCVVGEQRLHQVSAGGDVVVGGHVPVHSLRGQGQVAVCLRRTDGCLVIHHTGYLHTRGGCHQRQSS